MEIKNNKGEKVGEMNTTITKDGKVIMTNTMYDNVRRILSAAKSYRDRGGAGDWEGWQQGTPGWVSYGKPISRQQCFLGNGRSGFAELKLGVFPLRY